MKLRQIDAEYVVRYFIRKMVEDPDTVRGTLPDGWSPQKGVIITVQSDGTQVSQTAWTEEAVRVSVHGDTKPLVRSILSNIDAQIQGTHIALGGVSVRTQLGMIVTPSSLRGGHIASITYVIKHHRMTIPMVEN